MIAFLKSNVASLVASLCDFLLTILLVQWFKVEVLVATVAGTITGGVVNFTMGRHWVFQAGSGKAVRQFLKYQLVWAGNLLLNAGGVYLLVSYAELHYVASKVIISLMVAFLYNYPLQKNFVFSNNW